MQVVPGGSARCCTGACTADNLPPCPPPKKTTQPLPQVAGERALESVTAVDASVLPFFRAAAQKLLEVGWCGLEWSREVSADAVAAVHKPAAAVRRVAPVGKANLQGLAAGPSQAAHMRMRMPTPSAAPPWHPTSAPPRGPRPRRATPFPLPYRRAWAALRMRWPWRWPRSPAMWRCGRARC